MLLCSISMFNTVTLTTKPELNTLTLEWCSGLRDPFSICIKREKRRLIFFSNSYSLVTYQNTFSMTIHCTPSPHIYITYRMFGSTGPGANKSVEIVGPVYLHSVLLLSGPAASVCVCVCLCVCVCVSENV